MNIPIWPGSSSFALYSASYYNTPSTGSAPTPFGLYDDDIQFKIEADKIANYCARRLGYPLTDVELQDISFWAAFEDAIITYGNEIYSFQIRDNLLSLEGTSTSAYVNDAIITPNMGMIIKLSQQYAAEAGAGGNITYHSGALALTPGQQTYDLTSWAVSQSISGGIEIKKVFYQDLPAINQMYAPFGGFAGLGGLPAAGIYGGMYGGGYGGGYLMMPVAYDAGVIQGLEMSNQIRLSNYTFELINNKLTIFPIPTVNDSRGGFLWFEYIKLEDRYTNSITQTGGNKVTNVSNAPYDYPTYSLINSVGKSWIYDYTLALSKEMLGYVRGKYGTIPIPGREVTLNQADLLSAATSEKQALIERLRAYLDETSKKALLERRKDESEFRKQEISNIPMVIYVG
jgi:hypothetical protein